MQITTETVKEFVKDKCYILKKDFEYENSKVNFKIKCSEGHVWETTWNRLQSNQGCPKCFQIKRSENAKLSIETVKKIARKANLKLLSTEYINNSTPLKVKCIKCDHISKMELRSIQLKIKKKSSCLKCKGYVFSIEEIREYGKKLGLKLLSTKYEGVKKHLTFKCLRCENTYNVSWDYLRAIKLKYCPSCRGTSQLANVITTETVKEKVKEFNGALKKNFEYQNNMTKFEVKCSKGHVFTKTWNSLSHNHWCPKCSAVHVGNAIKHDETWLHELCKEKGFKWLQKENETYTGIKTKYTFKCKYGHEWNTTPESIRNGYGCHECASHRTERKVRGLMEYIFSEPFNKAYPKWLNGMELDGYNENLKLAFEYNGYQHYEVAYFDGYSKKALRERQHRDKLKREACAEQGIELLEIPYTVKNLVKFIFKHIKRENMRKPSKEKILKLFKKHEYKRSYEPKLLTPETVSKIRKAILKGKSDKQIADHFKISIHRIEAIRTNRICYDPNWVPIKRFVNKTKYTKSFKINIINDIKNGKDTAYIMKTYSIPDSTVYRIRSEYGLNIRKEAAQIKDKFRQGMTMEEAVIKFNKSKSSLYRLRNDTLL